jgi:ATP-dependent protease ClpP protease subunit
LYNRFADFCKNIPSDTPGQKLYFYLCSKGGDLGWSSKIVDLMHSLSVNNVQIITIGYNKVHSSSIPIFASGDIRKVKNKDVQFFFHLPRVQSDISEEDRKRCEDSVFEYIAERMNQPVSTIYELSAKETYLEAIDAKLLGLVHEILE